MEQILYQSVMNCWTYYPSHYRAFNSFFLSNPVHLIVKKIFLREYSVFRKIQIPDT